MATSTTVDSRGDPRADQSGGEAAQAPAKPKGWIRKLVPYLRGHLFDLGVVLFMTVSSQAITAVVPLVQREIIDNAILRRTKPILPLLSVMLGLAGVRFFIAFWRRYMGARVTVGIEADLRGAVYDHLQRLDFARHDEMQTGQLVSRANNDVRQVEGLLGNFLPMISSNIVFMFIAGGAMIKLSPRLSVIPIVLSVAVFFIAKQMRKVVYPSSWDTQNKNAEVITVVEEAVSGARIVKAFGQEKHELHRLIESATNLFGATMRNTRISVRRTATMSVIPTLGQLGIFTYGGWMVLHGELSIGTFLAFQTYMIQVLMPVQMFSMMLIMAQNARAAAERIFEILDSTPLVVEKPDAIELTELEGDVLFENVTFGYMRSEPVLKGFNLHVQPGETVALVGASGSGKSTLALLLPRFYDVQEGSVLVDGVDIKDVKIEPLRRQIGVVFEESFLFSESVRSNISYGRPNATDEEIAAAAKAAEAHDFIMELPDGYETVVGERGLTLSGGQRQRVALARALLTNPRFLILDDATSSIDARIEEEIHSTLRRLMRGRTTILVAHRRSTLDLADRIVVVEDGVVLDSGTHEELMDRCAVYFELLSGPGDDAEGKGTDKDAPRPAPAAWTGGITESAWQLPDMLGGDAPALPISRAAMAGRGPAAGMAGMAAMWAGMGGGDAPGGGARPGGPGAAGPGGGTRGGGGGMGGPGGMRGGMGGPGGMAMGMAMAGGGGMGGGMPMGMMGGGGTNIPPDELAELIAKLPPVVDFPKVDIERESKLDPEFKLMRFVKPYGRMILVGMILVAIQAMIGISGPFIMRHGIDAGILQKSERALWASAGAFGVVTLATRVLTWFSGIYLGRMGQTMLLALRVRIFAQLQRLGIDYYDREMGGRILTRMTSDVTTMNMLLQRGALSAITSLVTFFGTTFVLYSMNWRLASMVMGIAPPMVAATLWFRRQSSKIYTRSRESLAAMNANFQESISGVRVAQAFVREGHNISEFRRVQGDYIQARLQSQRVSSMFFPFIEVLSAVALIIVLFGGDKYIAAGTLTAGALVAFLLYINTVFAPLQQLSQFFDTYQQARVALQKIRELMATPISTPELENAVDPGRIRGDIRFDNVTYRYYGTFSDALTGVSLHVQPGETVALVGETGAGKSTTIKLLARFYDATSGQVLVDGVDVTTYNLEKYRKNLGFIPQEPFLFSGTIRDNIAYGKEDATEEEVEAAARATSAHDFIVKQPFGYHQPVTERGRSLSAGQRQLIALARALLVDPRILLMDEATANLDLSTEARVTNAMGVLSRGRTTILIAHRLQTAKRADRILVVDKGHIIEEGSHDQLVAQGGKYAALWRSFAMERGEPVVAEQNGDAAAVSPNGETPPSSEPAPIAGAGE